MAMRRLGGLGIGAGALALLLCTSFVYLRGPEVSSAIASFSGGAASSPTSASAGESALTPRDLLLRSLAGEGPPHRGDFLILGREGWYPGSPFEANSTGLTLVDLRLGFFGHPECSAMEEGQARGGRAAREAGFGDGAEQTGSEGGGEEGGEGEEDEEEKEQCPHFVQCTGNFSHLGFCRNSQWDQHGIDRFVPHAAIYHLPQPVIQFDAHLVRGENLYISSTGHVFDTKFRYTKGGCSDREREFSITKATKVVRFDEVVLLQNVYSNNFFHQLVEIFPSVMQILTLLASKPSITVLANQELGYPALLRYFGIDERKINFALSAREATTTMYFGRVVYFPLLPPCHYSTKALWATIRDNYFGRTGPAILGGPLPSPAPLSELTITYLNRTSGHSQKPAERSLLDQEMLIKLVEDTVHPKRLQGYVSERLDGSIRTFAQTHILIGVHGAGLSNMVFMPRGSVVVEILPVNYRNFCFYNLARSLGLGHVLVMGEGQKNTPTKVEPEAFIAGVLEAVRILRDTSREADKGAFTYTL